MGDFKHDFGGYNLSEISSMISGDEIMGDFRYDVWDLISVGFQA